MKTSSSAMVETARVRRFKGWVILRLNFGLKGPKSRANFYGPLDGGMVIQLCRWKFSHKETLQLALFD